MGLNINGAKRGLATQLPFQSDLVAKYTSLSNYDIVDEINGNNASTISAGVYIRLMINSVEQSEFNTAVYRSFTGGQFHDLTSFAAPIVVSENDTISVQGRVTDNDIDLQGPNTVFDKSDAFTISLIEILKKP